jgi:hypothetical protein
MNNALNPILCLVLNLILFTRQLTESFHLMFTLNLDYVALFLISNVTVVRFLSLY